MILYIVIALIAIATMWYKSVLMRREAEGFYIDGFKVTILTLATISNVATVFFWSEVFQTHDTWSIFACVALLFLIDLLVYLGHKSEARRKGLDAAHYDITNDIKLQ